MRTGNEDESLRDDSDLEVDDGVELRVVVVGRLARTTGEGRTERIGEPGSADDDRDEGDSRQREVETVRKSVGEDLGKIPRVGRVRGQDTVNGKGHDGTVVEQGDDQDHEWREVELEREGEDREADDDTDGNGAGVDRVVPHTLEDDTGTADGVDDSGETGLSQDDIGGTTGGISSTLDGNTDVGTGESRSIVGTVTSHGAKVSESLETLDNLVLVLGEDTGETVRVEDHLVERAVFAF